MSLKCNKIFQNKYILGLFFELGEGDSLWSALAEYLGPNIAASSFGSGGGIG